MSRRNLVRIALYSLASLLLAGIIHIFVVLTVPGHVRAENVLHVYRFS